SAIEGRFKNALEGIGLDLALVGIFAGSLRAIKAMRRGDEAGAQEAMREVEELQAQRDADQEAMAAIEGSPSRAAEDVVPETREGIPHIVVHPNPPEPRGGTSGGDRAVAAVEIEPVRSEAEASPLRPQAQRYEP